MSLEIYVLRHKRAKNCDECLIRLGILDNECNCVEKRKIKLSALRMKTCFKLFSLGKLIYFDINDEFHSQN